MKKFGSTYQVGSRYAAADANLQELVSLLVPFVSEQSIEKRQQPVMALLHWTASACERQAGANYEWHFLPIGAVMRAS